MLIDVVHDELRRDIASFADPGTMVTLTPQGHISWTRHRVRYEAILQRGTGLFPDIRIRDQVLTYEGFLASAFLADLRDLAESISHQLQTLENFQAVSATDQTRDGDRSDACELILDRTTDRSTQPVMATRVLFVHGNAGTGKTSVLRQAARRQAERYLRGEVDTLLLYLDAQGKGLLQLEDVMARALQDLRAKFTYHSIATLARRYCVVPIVDGFDELIGPSSAREAFANLAQFLAQLDRAGAVVTSSRSAFIDYQTLHERAEEASRGERIAYEIYPVELLPWTDTEIFKYSDSRSSSDDLRRQVAALLQSPAGPLISKPFFLSKVCDLVLEGGSIQTEQDLVRQVVDAALEREATKLLDRQHKPVLTPDQHRLFCEAVAEEMWLEGTAELDLQTLRLLAELLGDELGLSREDARLLMDRAMAHGLLAAVSAGDESKRAFEHELFRFEFQAGQFAKKLMTPEYNLDDYLLRGEIPEDVARRVSGYKARSGLDVKAAILRLSQLAEQASRSSLMPVNGGTLAAGMVWNQPHLPEGLRFAGFNMRGLSLGSCSLAKAEFRNCIFERVDLGSASLVECRVEGTTFVACRLVGEGQWIGTSLLPEAFVGAVVPAGGGEREVYDPIAIAKRLKEMGALVPEFIMSQGGASPASAEVDLVETILRRTRTHYYLPESEPWVQRNLLANPSWNTVKRLMLKHGLLREAKFEKSGPAEVFWKLSMAPDAIWQARSEKGAAGQGRAFWAELFDPEKAGGQS